MTQTQSLGFAARFRAASLLLIIVAAVVLGFGYREIATHQVSQAAEKESIALARMMANHIESFATQFGDDVDFTNATINSRFHEEFHDTFQAMTQDLNVMKMLIYTLEGRVAYSSNLNEVGEIHSKNGNFERATKGQLSSKLIRVDNSDTELSHGASYVETFIPIHRHETASHRRDFNEVNAPQEKIPEKHAVRAVFQLYMDVDEDLAGLTQSQIIFMAGVLSVLLFVYGILSFLVRPADLALNQQFEDLEESEERFRVAADTANDAIISSNSSGHIVFLNRAARRLFGYSVSDAMGRSILDLIPSRYRHSHSEGFERANTKDRLKLHGQPVEVMGLTKNGREVPVELSLSIWEARGERHFTSIIRDISERKLAASRIAESEERFRMLVESDPEAIFVNCKGKFVFVNPGALDLFGAQNTDQLYGLPVIDFIHPDFHEFTIERAVSVLETGITPPLGTAKFLKLDGDPIDVEVTASRISWNGKPALQVIARDITERKANGTALRFAHFSLDNASDAVLWIKPDGSIFYVNEAACENLGYTHEEMTALTIRDIDPADSPDVWPRHWNELRKAKSMTFRSDHIRKSGTTIPVEVTANFLDFEGGEFNVAFVRNISDRIEAEEKLRKLSLAVEQSPASVMITDTLGIIEYVNPKFCQVTGYESHEVIGKKPQIIQSGNTPGTTYQDLWDTIHSKKEWRGELNNRKKNGELFWEHVSISPIMTEDGIITHFLGVKEDITVRKDYESRLLRQANYDSLTGLPNRILALDRLIQGVAHAHRAKSPLALMFLDLDDFKKVNDSLGHEAGDELLKGVAKRLANCLREGDTAARFGGDEFIIILPDIHKPTDAEIIAEKILKVVSEPFFLGKQEVFFTASIGISIYPDDDSEPRILMRNADSAMYQAKLDGGNALRFFTASMNVAAKQHIQIETELRHALDRNELSIHYQPLVEMKSGDILGAEALLRWNNNKNGNIPTEQVIRVAEDTGLIVPIGNWVLRNACLEAMKWRSKTGRQMYVAVNVSSRQFRGGGLINSISEALEQSGLPPESLELELTESVLLEESEETIRTIENINRMGVSFAIDDFGTGYSSLSYVRRYPFRTLKVDRSFVQDVTTNPEEAGLVQSIIAMAEKMNLKTVAEGIETQEQLEFLKKSGCQIAQGFLFSKPVPSNKFMKLL